MTIFRILLALFFALCLNLGANDFEVAKKAYKERDFINGYLIFEKLCKNGDANACVQAGLYHLKFASFQDLDAAILYCKKPCENGNLEGCNCLALGYRYKAHIASGAQAKELEKRANALISANCGDNFGESCAILGIDVRDGLHGKAIDEALSVEFFEKACNLGDPKGCSQLALAFKNGTGTQKDESKIAQILPPFCTEELLDIESCEILSQYYSANSDKIKANQYTDLICLSGKPEICNAQAKIYAEDENSTLNLARAKEFFEIACNSQFKDSCAGIDHVNAKIAIAENNQSVDPKDYFERACNAGYAKSCAKLGEFYANIDDLASRLYFKKACDLKDKSSCGK